MQMAVDESGHDDGVFVSVHAVEPRITPDYIAVCTDGIYHTVAHHHKAVGIIVVTVGGRNEQRIVLICQHLPADAEKALCGGIVILICIVIMGSHGGMIHVHV